MNTLVVYCHPCPESFTAAIRDVVVSTLSETGHDVALIDLYAEGFDPVMSAEERRRYHTEGANLDAVETHAEHLRWAEAVVFVYPTWWFGLPALLKGWLERVLVPGFAFQMPDRQRGSRPKLKNIRRVAVMTTCGATPLMTWLVGQPGRRTLLRGFRSVCHPFCRTYYMALYNMDTIGDSERRCHLARVRGAIQKMKPI